MQTNPSPAQTVKPREYELEQIIHQNQHTPGVRELLEYAKVKAAQAHANYLKDREFDVSNWATERAWLEVARVIEDGPKLDKINHGGTSNVRS